MAPERHLVKRFESPDRQRWLELYKRVDGFFCFEEYFNDQDDMRHLGYGIYKFVSPGWESGLYETAEGAEADARKLIPWLRDDSD